MTIYINKDIPVPSPAKIREITQNPVDAAEINQTIRESVQEFPPAINTGAFFAQTVRGPILPPYGTKDRDRVLRLMFRNEFNTLIQGTVSAIAKKFITTPWEINGDRKQNLYIPDANGRLKSIPAVEHYQIMLQTAQFGAGWETFCSRFLEDFFTQDFGAVLELIGPGEPIGPIEGPVMGIAQLDAGRCFITGNPYYPIMYFSLISGALHRMHTARVVRFVDSPSPDERFFGIGLCALSRAIAIAQRQMYMQMYIQSRVDDKPTPGINLWNGVTDPLFKQALQKYLREQESEELPVFGKMFNLFSINVDAPVDLQQFAFSQVPEKFDWTAYNSLDVDAVALAFGIDRQELWELSGRSLGSGAQSEILAQKARGKMTGFLFQNMERLINRRILPKNFEFTFKYRDENEETAIADQNLKLAQTAQTLAAIPGAISPVELRSFLAASSPQFKDALSTRAGQVSAPDAAMQTDAAQQQEAQVALEDDNPINPQAQSAQRPQSTQEVTPQQAPPMQKQFGLIADNFRQSFIELVNRALGGRLNRANFDDVLLRYLSMRGAQTFLDGKKEGGANEELDSTDEGQIQSWLLEQIMYLQNFGDAVYGRQYTPEQAADHADMWVNKSLRDVRNYGRRSGAANRNYKWVLGPAEKHCHDCPRLDGQVHKYREWYARGIYPGSNQTECKGYQCQCQLIPTDEPARGRF